MNKKIHECHTSRLTKSGLTGNIFSRFIFLLGMIQLCMLCKNNRKGNLLCLSHVLYHNKSRMLICKILLSIFLIFIFTTEVSGLRFGKYVYLCSKLFLIQIINFKEILLFIYFSCFQIRMCTNVFLYQKLQLIVLFSTFSSQFNKSIVLFLCFVKMQINASISIVNKKIEHTTYLLKIIMFLSVIC